MALQSAEDAEENGEDAETMSIPFRLCVLGPVGPVLRDLCVKEPV
jgi:hypothetical protein